MFEDCQGIQDEVIRPSRETRHNDDKYLPTYGVRVRILSSLPDTSLKSLRGMEYPVSVNEKCIRME